MAKVYYFEPCYSLLWKTNDINDILYDNKKSGDGLETHKVLK